MNVVLFGASGMIGQGVLRECLLDPYVGRVLCVGRSSIGQQDPKLRVIVHKNLLDYSPIEDQLSGYDACFFCLGVSSAGMAEADYRRITYDVTVAAAQALARLNPTLTFIYVSGVGTDSSETSRTMWARVKGQTENALLRMPFRAAYMFRPGAIVPLHGIKSRTAVYRVAYALAGPILPWLERQWPEQFTTTEKLGRAMLNAVKQGAPKAVIETRDIAALAG
jgi:uncharacterized protein YbjT (DUF2867 family)